MNRGELTTQVQILAGDTSGALITTTMIHNWLNEAQNEIARKTECLKEHAQTNGVAEDGTYDLPDDFIRIEDLTWDGVSLVETERSHIKTLNRHHDADPVVGLPRMFYTWGRTIGLFPSPDTSGTGNLDIWYVKLPASLDDDTDVPEIPAYMHTDMIRYAVARAKEVDEDWDAAGKLDADLEVRLIQSKDDAQNNGHTFPAVRLVPGDD